MSWSNFVVYMYIYYLETLGHWMSACNKMAQSIGFDPTPPEGI